MIVTVGYDWGTAQGKKTRAVLPLAKEKTMQAKSFAYKSFIIFFLLISIAGFSEESSRSSPRWSIALSGGVNHLAVGHLNLSLASMNEVLLGGGMGVFSTSEVKKLAAWNGVWDAELRFNITRKIGVGIAISNPLHLSNESNIPIFSQYSVPPDSLVGSFVSRPDVQYRVPIKVSAHYSLPLFSRLDFLVSLGCGYYSGKMKEALNYEINDGTEIWWHRSYWESRWKSALGFHGGIGAEYSLSRRLALVVDVQYRLMKISNLRATMNVDSNRLPYLFYSDEQGILYLWAWGEAGPVGLAAREFYVWEGNPPEYGGTLEYGGSIGKAILDLSGLSLRLGFKIGLF